jgi:predicted ATP-dependent endonuclease of OLD family
MFDSFERFKDAYNNDKSIVILYLGDYDPSGMDMIRDIRDRIKEFYE